MSKLIPGVNDLATKYPAIAAQWHPTKNTLTPQQVTIGAEKMIWWICKEGHEWQALVYSRKRSGCPYCSGNKIWAGFNDLQTTRPELAADWHPSRNGNLTPCDITAGSNRKAWWLGQCGHEWEATISSRSIGTGCPICSNKQTVRGVNDLETTHPHLAKQWHPTRNGNLFPYHVVSGNSAKVWWLCEYGHEWDASIASRAGNGHGCPFCDGQRPIKGENDFATTHPELAAQWHPAKNGKLSPQDVMRGTSRKVWWMCEKGHEWKISPASRTRGTGCPICDAERKSSFPEQAVLFYVQKYFPDAVSQQQFNWLKRRTLDIYIPSLKTAIEYDGDFWHDDISKDIIKNELCYKNKVRLIRIREPKTPLISGECIRLSSLSLSDLKIAIESLLKNYLDVRSELDVDIERDTTAIYSLIEHYEKENSLAEKYPEIAAQWHPTKNGKLRPSQVYWGTKKPVWWLCEHGHEYQKPVIERAQGQNCPVCANKRIIVGVNDLATTRPDLAAQWHPAKNGSLTPSQVTAGTHRKVWWLCEHGHEWLASCKDRSSGRKCPVCQNRVVVSGFNDLATTHPLLAKEWHPHKNGNLSPRDVTFGSNKKVWWKCVSGHEWKSTIANRSSGRNCPQCNKINRITSHQINNNFIGQISFDDVLD